MNGQTLNGTKRPGVPTWGPLTPIHIGGLTEPEVTATSEPPASAPSVEPAVDLVAAAEAAAIRARTEAEAEARRIAAEAEAEAVRIKAVTEAEKQELANRRAAMKLEADEAAHAKRVADLKAQRAAVESAAKKATEEAEAEAERENARAVAQQRSERWWKWGARGIYAIGLAIAAPVQFLDFWDRAHPFMVVAPALLEGFALVLAFGAAWAVAHRRDVAPYRIGIMLGAMIAAAINLRGGMTNPVVGLNAGILGAVASLGGPIVLMAYEHGIAQKADGIPSWRERRTAEKKAAEEQAAKDAARAEREQAAKKAAAEREAQRAAAEAEQKRKDEDRRQGHKDVWEVAEALRSARGLPVVTDALWGEAWLLVTGSPKVGIRPEIEAASRSARQLMKDATDNALSLVESQMSPRERRDPNAPDGRRFNGGTPPRRTPGDTAPFHPAAKVAAADTARQNTARKDA